MENVLFSRIPQLSHQINVSEEKDTFLALFTVCIALPQSQIFNQLKALAWYWNIYQCCIYCLRTEQHLWFTCMIQLQLLLCHM